MKIIQQTEEARQFLQQGKIIAYPTEAVFGLGCDPFNQEAVETLLALKERPTHKGLIVLIANWFQLESLIATIPSNVLDTVRKTWPGPVTWVFPKAETVPNWVSGQFNTIAIRMSAHPIAHQLCMDGPIVSTSANRSGQEPAMSLAALKAQFPHGIDGFVAGFLGGALQPSAIYNALDGKRLR